MSEKSLEQLAKLEISEDQLCAELVLRPGIEPTELNHISLRALIEAKGIRCTELTDERIADLLKEYSRAGDEPVSGVVAEGTPPVHGTDGFFEVDSLIAEILERARQAANRDPNEKPPAPVDGDIDHYEQSTIPMVEEDQPLGRIITPQPGTDGVDVFGKVIKAKTAQEASFHTDDSVQRSESGWLTAAHPGVVVRTPDSIRVNRDLVVKGSVDFSVGNIVFPGNVTIRQGVRDMFRVCSEKTLEVSDLVEAATLVAKDLILHRGMAGRSKGSVTVERDAKARYFDSINCSVGRDLTIEREMTNCNVTIGRDLIASNATVMGGTLSVGRQADVGRLGADSGTAFEVNLGELGRIDYLMSQGTDQLTKLLSRTKQTQSRMETLQDQIVSLGGNAADELTELQFLLSSNAKREANLKECLGRAAGLVLRHASYQITVRGLLNPGVVLCAAGRRARINSPISGPIRVRMNGEEPTVEDLDTSSVTPLSKFADITDADSWVDPRSVLNVMAGGAQEGPESPPETSAA